MRTQLVDGLFADLLQVVRFLRVYLFIISTDEDASLRTKSSAIINLRGVPTKLNKYIAKFVVPC